MTQTLIEKILLKSIHSQVMKVEWSFIVVTELKNVSSIYKIDNSVGNTYMYSENGNQFVVTAQIDVAII